MHTYSEHQFPSLEELSCHSLKSDQNQKRKCGGGKLPRHMHLRYMYLPHNTCVMMYMNLEGGERKLTFYLGYMSGSYVPVPVPVLYGRR